MLQDLTYTTFGNQTNNADAIVIDLLEDKMTICEFSLKEFKPLFISTYNAIDTENPKDILKAFQYFMFGKKNYSTVYVNYFSSQFTLCPNQFYNEEAKKELLEFNCGSVHNKLIITNDITAQIKLIFSIPEAIQSLLNQTFPNHHLKHSSSVLAQLMLNSSEFINDSVLIYIQNSHIEVVVKNQQQLMMINQYAIKTEQDVLYYLLFLIEQHQLNTQQISICVAGNIAANSQLYTLLKKYIKNIRLATGHKNLNYSEVSGIPQHYNFTLLNRLFCE